jgi:hypothetical protein
MVFSSGFSCAREQNRSLGVVKDVLGDGAEGRSGDAAAPVRSHADQVDV